VGGGNSAGQLALFLATVGATVSLVIRGRSLSKSMSAYLVQEIAGNDRIRVLLNSSVTHAVGEQALRSLTILDDSSGVARDVRSEALFVMIGAEPHTDWLEPGVARDERGFVLTGTDVLADETACKIWPLSRTPFLLETSMPGVFAAGDVRHGSIKRVAGAVGEGAASILLISQYLREQG
jgi:thioredoxin reductase (NADPH)